MDNSCNYESSYKWTLTSKYQLLISSTWEIHVIIIPIKLPGNNNFGYVKTAGNYFNKGNANTY